MSELLTPVHIIFYLFAALSIASALVVITVRNPVRSVLALVVTFFSMSGIWMILHAEFLSIILLLVYVGAVMTLFLFVLMMLNIDTEPSHTGFVRYLPFGLIIILVTLAIMVVNLSPHAFAMPLPTPISSDQSNTKVLGELLYTQYAYPFEIAGVLLLAAIIAAITLTNRGPLRRKVQKVDKQVSVNPEDRVRLINVPSEPRQGV